MKIMMLVIRQPRLIDGEYHSRTMGFLKEIIDSLPFEQRSMRGIYLKQH